MLIKKKKRKLTNFFNDNKKLYLVFLAQKFCGMKLKSILKTMGCITLTYMKENFCHDSLNNISQNYSS